MSFLLPGENVNTTGVSMIIYGPPGVGKTSLIKTLLGWTYEGGWNSQEPYCKPEEVLVLDVESGKEVLAKERKLCCTVIPVAEETLSRFKNEVLPKIIEDIPSKMPFKFVVLDNVSEYEKFLVLGLMKHRGKDLPDKREWGNSSVYVRKHLRDLRSLTFKGVNVIFNFWDMMIPTEDKEGNLENIICPMCMRTTWKEYTGLVSHYAYMGISPKTGTRFLQFETHGMVQAKTRCDKLGVYEGKVTAGRFEKANLTTVIKKIRGEI